MQAGWIPTGIFWVQVFRSCMGGIKLIFFKNCGSNYLCTFLGISLGLLLISLNNGIAPVLRAAIPSMLWATMLSSPVFQIHYYTMNCTAPLPNGALCSCNKLPLKLCFWCRLDVQMPCILLLLSCAVRSRVPNNPGNLTRITNRNTEPQLQQSAWNRWIIISAATMKLIIGGNGFALRG